MLARDQPRDFTWLSLLASLNRELEVEAEGSSLLHISHTSPCPCAKIMATSYPSSSTRT
uniref:Uncharacterized protein n=1 Tax=Amphimedon queenslandica TaxID=400682 RepID=A0A1X7TVQ1_AMPQE